MSLQPGDLVGATKLRLKAYRGATFLKKFRVWEGQSNGCSAPVAREPRDLSSFNTLTATAEIQGTSKALPITAAFVEKGSATTPAVIEFKVLDPDLELCFAEGAEQAFMVTCVARRPGLNLLVAHGRVTVKDTAFGAIR